MRLFVAVDLPAEEKERLHAATLPLRETGLPIRWLEPESIHLTLKFLGWVRPENADAMGRIMADAAAKTDPFVLSLDGYGAFPSIRRPRVIWAGVEATPPLRCLKHDVEWAFAPHGFEREVRAFQPHITLGRAKRDARAGDLREFERIISEMSYRSTVQVDTVDLMRSQLLPTGARYDRIASARLGLAPVGGDGAGPAA
ncbi:MAG TPA: RNA 2',3'-cyclic phosphodiesterase [Longimicrobiales bacterium]